MANEQLTEERLQELLAICERATHTPLTVTRYEHGGGRFYIDNSGLQLIADFYDEGNREYYAVVQPTTCAALVREVIGLRGALNGDKRLRCKHCRHYRLFPCAKNCGCDCEYETEDRDFSSVAVAKVED